ncbi:MAG: cyanobactin biosynthesis PatC/TenC/TruC family protein [Oscillatoria sp. SIO1A7]|nr:cyanobactin biosynthesis PatC/TenC/TruC family protein [Oscillatoria sp. SIO1A7]
MPRKNTPKNTDSQPETPPTPAKPTPSDAPKSYVPTTMTGLQDYSYWWRYARDRAKTVKPNTKTFRRGRIWA